MASGTINFTPSATTESGSYIEGKIEWRSTANIELNTSDVNIHVYVRKKNSSMTLTIPTDGKWIVRVTCNGKGKNSTIEKSVLEEWVKLGSFSYNAYSPSGSIEHDVDGSKIASVSCSITAPTGTSFEGLSTQCSVTIKLDTILRATTIDSLECSTSYVDGTITAKYTPKSSTLYNRRIVYLNVDGALTTIRSADLDTKTASQQTSTINLDDDELSDIYAVVKTTTKAKIRVTFQTYSDSGYKTKVGDDQYREITLSIPTSVAPTAELTITPVNSNSWIASKNVYVAGLSGVKATLSVVTSAGIKEDELTTTITYDGATYNAQTLNVTTLKKSGSIEFTAKVIDPRGRSATVTKSITVLPYSSPAVTSMQVDRGTYNSGWTSNDDGQDVRIVFKTTLALVNQGNLYSAMFELNGKTTAPNQGTTTGLSSGASCTVYFLNLSGEKSHKIRLITTDLVGNTGAAEITIPTMHVTIEYRANGKGIAFGKTSEKDAFECAMDAEFSGSLAKKMADNSLLEIDDTGWISMGTSSSVSAGTDTGRNGPGCYYRVINKRHVYVVFNAGFTFSGSAIVVNGTALPAGLRPKRKAYAMNLVSGRAFARTGVNTSGNVVIDWVQNIASAAQTESASTTWIDGYVDYWI